MALLESAESGRLKFLANDFQLGDGLEVLPPAGGTLEPDQRVQGDAEAVDAEDANGLCFLLEILVTPAPGHFSEEVERAERGRECEVEAGAEAAAA